MKVARLLPVVAIVGVIITACGGSNNPTTTTATVPSDLSISSFDASFSYMSKLIGKGFMDCVTAWKVSNPKVFTLDGGEDTDPNAFSFAQGYNSVVWGDTTTPEPKGKTNSAGYTLVGDQVAPGWDNTKGGAVF